MSSFKTLDLYFERLSGLAARLFGHLIVFLIALVFIAYWFLIHDWDTMSLTDAIRDVILAITFLSFFIIQKSFSHFSTALHLKLNELIAAHENARNQVVKAEEKTSDELEELAKDHDRLLSEAEAPKKNK